MRLLIGLDIIDKVKVKIKRGFLSDKIIYGLENAYKYELQEGLRLKKYVLLGDIWILLP